MLKMSANVIKCQKYPKVLQKMWNWKMCQKVKNSQIEREMSKAKKILNKGPKCQHESGQG